MTKGINFLELLFVAVLVLHFAGVQPFAGWGWFTISLPLVIYWVLKLLRRVWYVWGFDKMIYEIVEMNVYELKLKKAIKKATKQNAANFAAKKQQ